MKEIINKSDFTPISEEESYLIDGGGPRPIVVAIAIIITSLFVGVAVGYINEK